jgi:hypothetical protein
MTTRSVTLRWLASAAMLALTLAAGACGDDNPPTQPSPQPQPTPTPTVTAGRVVASPLDLGIVLATPFAFTAENFSASNGAALTYTWDFGDGVRQTGGASVTHVYGGPGLFVIGVSAATAAGQSASATAEIGALTVDGRWALLDVGGGELLLANTSLSQNGTSVSGDDTRLNCRYGVSGIVSAPRNISLTWARGRNDCQAFSGAPETVRFTGTVETGSGGFVGTLDTGTAARLLRCPTGRPCV